MNKEAFLSSLEESLSGLSREDVAERMAFYSEAIDDRLEDGLTEEEAVAQLGSADAIAAQIVDEVPQTHTPKKKHRLRALEIILLVLGSPVWISLLAAGFAVVISLYAAIWAVVVSLWAVQVALGVSCVGCFIGTWIICFAGNVYAGLAVLSVSLFSGGASILAFYGCKALTKGAAWLTKKSAIWLVGLFVRKESAK